MEYLFEYLQSPWKHTSNCSYNKTYVSRNIEYKVNDHNHDLIVVDENPVSLRKKNIIINQDKPNSLNICNTDYTFGISGVGASYTPCHNFIQFNSSIKYWGWGDQSDLEVVTNNGNYYVIDVQPKPV